MRRQLFKLLSHMYDQKMADAFAVLALDTQLVLLSFSLIPDDR